jgi:hypothetical protein
MSELDPTAPPPPNRVLALALAALAVAALVTSTFSRRWLASPIRGLDMGMGLRETSACGQTGWGDAPMTTCEVKSNAELIAAIDKDYPGHTSGAFVPCGWITFGANLLAIAGLLGAAGLAAAGRRPTLPMSPASVALLALLATLIVGCVFVATKPGGATGVGVAWGFWVFAVGVVAGIAAAQLLAKLIRPVDPDLLAGAMQPDQY